MYFRFSKTATDFFNAAEFIFKNWKDIQTSILKNCRDPHPTTDVVYALAATIVGVDRCTLPTMDFINFVHMKPAINNWPNTDWTEFTITEFDLPMIRIANQNQYHPIHYHEKAFATQELIKLYEQRLYS
jgi:hypothetical protein